MNSDENDEIYEDGHSLSELLLPDTPEIKEMKSIYEKEYEYSDYLSEIEFATAGYYYKENRNLKDKDVILTLKNIKQNRDKPISFFKKDLEIDIIESLIEPLEEKPLTNHEFTLILDYVLWVIDNRSWVEDKQAYVKWITYVLGFFSTAEEGNYERQFKKLARKVGLSASQVDMLLMKRDVDDFFEEDNLFEGIIDKAEIFDIDRAADDLETGFFLMTEDEKFDFLLDKGPDYVELVQTYVLELQDKGDLEKIQAFYKKSIEKHKDFFPMHIIMGIAYAGKDPALAKSYFEEAIKAAEKFEEIPEETKKIMKEDINHLIQLLMEESAEKPKEKTDERKKANESKPGKRLQ
jgi:hypothetical protein